MQASRPHVSQVQKEYLLKYLQKNPRLTFPKFSADFTVKDAQMEWRTLAATLNRLPGKGSVKSWKRWRKTWQDLKSKTKIKYHQQGGCLTKEEQIVIKISGELNDNNNQLPADEDIDAEIEDNSIDLNKYLAFCKENNQNHNQKKTGDRNMPENILIQIIPSDDQQDDSGDQHMDDSYFSANQNEEAEIIKQEEGDILIDVHDSVMLGRQRADKKKPTSTASYHDKKLYHLNRMARANERAAWAQVRMAEALEKLASSGVGNI